MNRSVKESEMPALVGMGILYLWFTLTLAISQQADLALAAPRDGTKLLSRLFNVHLDSILQGYDSTPVMPVGEEQLLCQLLTL